MDIKLSSLVFSLVLQLVLIHVFSQIWYNYVVTFYCNIIFMQIIDGKYKYLICKHHKSHVIYL